MSTLLLQPPITLSLQKPTFDVKPVAVFLLQSFYLSSSYMTPLFMGETTIECKSDVQKLCHKSTMSTVATIMKLVEDF